MFEEKYYQKLISQLSFKFICIKYCYMFLYVVMFKKSSISLIQTTMINKNATKMLSQGECSKTVQ